MPESPLDRISADREEADEDEWGDMLFGFCFMGLSSPSSSLNASMNAGRSLGTDDENKGCGELLFMTCVREDAEEPLRLSAASDSASSSKNPRKHRLEQ